jgi:hypothetical protein
MPKDEIADFARRFAICGKCVLWDYAKGRHKEPLGKVAILKRPGVNHPTNFLQPFQCGMRKLSLIGAGPRNTAPRRRILHL